MEKKIALLILGFLITALLFGGAKLSLEYARVLATTQLSEDQHKKLLDLVLGRPTRIQKIKSQERVGYEGPLFSYKYPEEARIHTKDTIASQSAELYLDYFEIEYDEPKSTFLIYARNGTLTDDAGILFRRRRLDLFKEESSTLGNLPLTVFTLEGTAAASLVEQASNSRERTAFFQIKNHLYTAVGSGTDQNRADFAFNKGLKEIILKELPE